MCESLSTTVPPFDGGNIPRTRGHAFISWRYLFSHEVEIWVRAQIRKHGLVSQLLKSETRILHPNGSRFVAETGHCYSKLSTQKQTSATALLADLTGE